MGQRRTSTGYHMVQWLRYLSRWEEGVSLVLLVVIIACLFTGVLCRYVLNYSLIWIEEVTRISLIWLTFLGAAILTKKRALIRLDVLPRRLSKEKSTILEIMIDLLGIIFALFLIYEGLKMVHLTWIKPTPVLHIPQGLLYLALPVAGVSMGIHSVILLYSYFRPCKGEAMGRG